MIDQLANEPGGRMVDAYEQIRIAILGGDFAPGARLSQVKIAEHLGLSRTPVREALRLIEKEGLIVSQPGRQVVISQTSMADLDELYALRINLDSTTVRATAEALTDDDLAAMSACLSDMDVNDTADRFNAYDVAHRQFHMIPIERAGPRHADQSRQLNEHAERYRRLYLGEQGSYRQSRDEHRAIMEACTARDGDLLASLLAEHYARIALTIVARIDPLFDPKLVRAAMRVALQGRTAATLRQASERLTDPERSKTAIGAARRSFLP